MSFLPTIHQELLLKACLLDGPDAIAAWETWRVDVDVDRLDSGSRKLLPLLYHNLRKQHVEDPLMQKLKTTFLATWYENQLLIRSAVSLISLLHKSGVPTMALKGAALSALYYEHIGLRPMADMDLLVPPTKAAGVISRMKQAGWAPGKVLPGLCVNSYLKIKHGFEFRDESGRKVDLHWHVLDECLTLDSDLEFWESRCSLDLNGEPTSCLNPADQLLHTCVHGAKWSETPPIRWVADAMMILNSPEKEVDWNRLCVQAQKRRLVMPIKDCLTYLKHTLDAPIPSDFLRQFGGLPISGIERRQYKASISTPAELGPFWRVRRQAARFFRQFRGGAWYRLPDLLFSFCFLGIFELFRDVLTPKFSKWRQDRQAD